MSIHYFLFAVAYFAKAIFCVFFFFDDFSSKIMDHFSTKFSPPTFFISTSGELTSVNLLFSYVLTIQICIYFGWYSIYQCFITTTTLLVKITLKLPFQILQDDTKMYLNFLKKYTYWLTLQVDKWQEVIGERRRAHKSCVSSWLRSWVRDT